MIAKESSSEMLDRVEFSGIHDRFLIWGSHAKIKRCDRICTDVILAGYINARLQFDMVYGETCYFFFQWKNLSFCFFQLFLMWVSDEKAHIAASCLIQTSCLQYSILKGM